MTSLLLLLALIGCDGADPEPQAPTPPEAPTKPETPEATGSTGSNNASAEEEPPDGRWRRARPTTTSVEEQLESIGYLEGYEKAPENTGVLRLNEEQVAKGYNFYVSGHGTEATLMDMKGKVLHTWSYDFSKAFPDIPPSDFPKDNGHQYWRRAHLYDNGDILAIHEGLGILRLDANSTLKWARPNGAHHHTDVQDDGKIYVLTRTLEKRREGFQKPVVEDAVTVLSPEGEELKRVSILSAALNSDLQEVKDAIGKKGDLFHTNSLQVLDGRMAKLIPEFRAGNILLSSRRTHLAMVLDMEAEKIVWARSGSWRKQHDIFVIDEDSMIIFDNNERTKKSSSVLVINPKTGETQWSYQGNRSEPFFTQSCGANQRLPNGNTLIVESNFGRAFEVTADKAIVWEFLSPHRAGADNELIATLFDVHRVPASMDISWSKNTP